MHLDHRFRQGAPAGPDPAAVIIAADLHDRVEHRQNVQTVRRDLAHDGINEEGPVPPDHFKNIAPEIATVLAHRGANPHSQLADLPVGSEVPELGGQLDDIVQIHGGQIIGERIAPHLNQEAFRIRANL